MISPFIGMSCFTVQNGSLHQKDAVHDNDFEPYLSSQSNQVSLLYILYLEIWELSNLPNQAIINGEDFIWMIR